MSDIKLKPCPFCGGKGELIVCKPENFNYVKCRKCGACSYGVTADDEQAIRNWNTRYERTCRNFGLEEGTNGEMYDFACSACGFCCDVTEPNYCPYCGVDLTFEYDYEGFDDTEETCPACGITIDLYIEFEPVYHCTEKKENVCA